MIDSHGIPRACVITEGQVRWLPRPGEPDDDVTPSPPAIACRSKAAEPAPAPKPPWPKQRPKKRKRLDMLPGTDGLSPRDRTVQEAARRLAPNDATPLGAADLIEPTGLSLSVVALVVSRLRKRGCWPWPRAKTGRKVPTA